ncbi:putative protein MSS51 homolog, mitochondrial isoform X2 [Narcine bancroftii]|uniref:putative protein MSS51 homolog, mitochondrial isoform X2 n=1 Tax=Narcine bancroftii TaxID=1343680 RepID=UPI003832311C
MSICPADVLLVCRVTGGKKSTMSDQDRQNSSSEQKADASYAGDVYTDTLGFVAMDSNVPGLSKVILQKLNMQNYNDYRAALEGRKSATEFGIRTYQEMFQRLEDTYKFCAECKKLPEALLDQRGLRRCKRCQNVYYCGKECQRASWPLHKKFCKKLKWAATDRLLEWLVFTGDIPFPSKDWTRAVTEVKGWDDWFSMQEDLGAKLNSVLSCKYMDILWADAGKPRPEDEELLESIRRVTTDFQSRPVTIGFALHSFGIDPLERPLTIHVIGASHTETLNARLEDYDELARMFPGNDGIEVVMIGPEVVEGPTVRPPLQTYAGRRRVYLSGWKGLYHVYWETMVETERAARPHLVIGFHPGFHVSQGLTEGWLPTLLLLRDYQIPAAFTMYSDQELKYSLQILEELETRVTSYGTNPFASLKFEQVQSNPNKQLVSSNSAYLMFHGLVESTEGKASNDLGQEDSP